MAVLRRPASGDRDPHPQGRLAAAMLQVLAATIADHGRLQRGRALAADAAVGVLAVDTGRLTAGVQGSLADPYDVRLEVPVVARPTTPLDRLPVGPLVPAPAEVRTSCTCADPDDGCKHVIAVLVAFAAEVAIDPHLLIAWRCAPPGSGPKVAAGERSRPIERRAPDAATERPSTDERPTRDRTAPRRIDRPARSASAQVAGPTPPDDDLPDEVRFSSVDAPPDEPALTGASRVGMIDLAAVVRSALDALRGEPWR